MSAQPNPPAGDDEYLDLGGERVRLFSTDHLTIQNVYAALSDDKLIEQFERYEERVGENTPGVVKAMHRALKTGEYLEGKPVDDVFLRVAVREGTGYGLGAAWGVSPEAHLLYAGAARLMTRMGYKHDEPLRGMIVAKPDQAPPDGPANDRKGEPPRGMKP
ncbi:MAG: hypothetical protein KI792_06625 [Alphaproteobacteria bacterium]|nr:hypothetical protein [Alphaproteobacteria bacterium SS10]